MVLAVMLVCAALMAWLLSATMDLSFWPVATFFAVCALIGVLREKLRASRERQRRR